MNQDQSALEGLRLLHASIEARLKKNEDYRVKLVLDRALAELTQSPVQQLQAQAAAGMVVQQSPAPAPAPAPASESPANNAVPIVPAKNGLASKMAELADSLHFATGR
jgi:hypothetical protein